MQSKLQNKEYPTKKIHYAMIRDNEPEIIQKLDRALGFYRINYEKNIKGVEVIYDTPNHLLSGAGIVISKQFEDGKYSFRLRKLSYLPTALRTANIKTTLSSCKKNELPKDYPLVIATAINNAFGNVFKIDLAEVVKQTIPIYEIKIIGRLYSITSGLGMKGQLMFEKTTYKDLVGGKKVKTKGATVTLPGDPKFKNASNEILNAIERRCKELLMYDETRFEIAQRILTPRMQPKKEVKKKSFKNIFSARKIALENLDNPTEKTE